MSFQISFLNSIIYPIFKGGDRSPQESKSYRPVALTWSLCRLTERTVLNRLVYYIKSLYRPSYATSSGHQQWVQPQSILSNLGVKLDQTSAFNKVKHDGLSDTMEELTIPLCYGRFYKGLLSERRFWVRIGDVLSGSAWESCGFLQGTVSSPWLFDIYMTPNQYWNVCRWHLWMDYWRQ